MSVFRLTADPDSITGTAGDDLIQVPSGNTNLAEADVVAAGAGHDILLFERTSALSVAFGRFGGLSGIDEIDVTAATSALLSFTDAMILQSDSDRLQISFDADPLVLDLRSVTFGTGTLVLSGTGPVTLYDAPEQAVTVANGIAGHVTGGSMRDTLTGGSGGDTLDGAAGDDTIFGGGGSDLLTGGAGFDRLEGGTGNDTLDGGADADLLSGGLGSNRATGGSGSDTFVVTAGEVLTITDFDPSDRYERIDLRGALAAGQGFGGLTITDGANGAVVTLPGGGTSIVLNGVAASALGAANFVFPGDTVTTMAAGLNPVADFQFTATDDAFTAGSGAQIFELKGSIANLAPTDSFNGGSGIDTLRVWGDSRGLSADRLAGMSGIEIIDLTGATGTSEVQLTQAMVDTSALGHILVRFGPNPITMLTAQVDSAAGVMVEGTGLVTLRDIPNQGVTISDALAGNVTGQNKDDVIIGGAKDDTISGSGGRDTLSGMGGDDTISGGDGDDTITGGTGTNLVSGGDGTDRFIVTAGEALTITDFAGRANYERIDLRSFAGLAFADLVLTAVGSATRVDLPGGTRIVLEGVAPASLARGDFIFDGEIPGDHLTLSDDADLFTGGPGDDLIDLVGASSQLDASIDVIDGGDGLDTLRVFGDSRDLGVARLGALSSIEVIDLSAATGDHRVTITARLVSTSDNGKVLVRHGDSTVFLDTQTVEMPGQVVVDGAGLVTLRDVPGQGVTISDATGGNVLGGNDDNTIIGGAKADWIDGAAMNDTISGGGGDDQLYGGTGRDTITGGAGKDAIYGGDGDDILISDSGADTVTGGDGNDSFVLKPGSAGTTITDYDAANLVERIDLTAFTGLHSTADLTITAVAGGAHVTGAGGLNLTLKGVVAADLDRDDFLFAGQDALQYHIQLGTTTERIQQLLDGAPEGAVISFDAGRFDITQTLRINHSGITLTGAGQDNTILRTMIPDDQAAPTVLVQPDGLLERLGTISANAAEGSTTVTLADIGDLQVGDLLYINQANDDAYLQASGNTGWIDPGAADPAIAEDYYLRESRSEIVAINGNTVTLREALPYTFEAGKAMVGRSTFLSDVTLSNFAVEGRWGASDPFFFENTMEAWTSIAAVEFDGVRDSLMQNLTVDEPAADAFKYQRTYDVRGDKLTAYGAHDKDGASGYHFLLQEAFATTLTNLSSTNGRHAVLFSSYSAEHYNSVHLLFSNRDINFHGSADSHNTVTVDVMRQDYPAGSDPQWMAVNSGVFPLHPHSTIGLNTIYFKDAVTGERNDTVFADPGGAKLSTGVGNDTIFGGPGDDIIDPGENGDTVRLGGGHDTLIRDFADFTDTVRDFDPGAGGDVMIIRGTAYTRFQDLRILQDGADAVLDFGPGGQTIFLDTSAAAFTAANFRFAAGTAPGQLIAAKASQTFIVGTDRSDTITIARAHIDSGVLAILAGTGFDTVALAATSLTGNLGATGSYAGVEEFDLSMLDRIAITVENPLVSQSNSGKLTIGVGDSGTAAQIDLGPLGRGKLAFIDGAREVDLTGGREHVIKSTDRIGTDIHGDSLRDVIYGGQQGDYIDGGAGNDVIFGAAGDDELHGGAGNDILNGGPGSDTIYVDDLGDKVAESNRWAGHDTVIASVDFRLGTAHVEDLRLTGTARLGAGNGLMNTIWGNDQDNTLDGGKNVDTLIGGKGDDTYLLRSPGDTAVEAAGEGIDTVLAFRSITLDANVENLYIQTLRNAAGVGIDGVNGIGNELDNVIIGNPFANSLSGREGNDKLKGQGGADSFVFDRPAGAGNIDHIVDFSHSEGDRLQLKADVFGGLAKGLLATDAFATGTVAADASDRVIYDQATGRLWVDADGSGAGDQVLVAILDNHAALVAADVFVF